MDPLAIEVGEAAAVVFAVGDALGDAWCGRAMLQCTRYSASTVRRYASPRISTGSRISAQGAGEPLADRVHVS